MNTKPNIQYRHYKGDVYDHVSTARLESDPSVAMIVYRGADGSVWTRPEKEFFELVEYEGKAMLRFTLIVSTKSEIPTRISCYPMDPEDGRRAYYYDTPELYIDVEEDVNIKGKFSIFIKDRITGTEEFLDQVDVKTEPTLVGVGLTCRNKELSSITQL